MAGGRLHTGEDLGLHAPRAALILLLAAAPPPPTRWHFELPGAPRVLYSVLFSRGPEGDVTRLLLDAPGARLALSSAQDPSENDSTESVTDADSGERFARRLVLSGYGAIPECAAVRKPDACLVFTGARGSVSAALSAFAGEDAPRLRARIAALVTPAFDAKLTALAPVFPRTAELFAYGDDFLRLVWPGRFPRAPSRFPAARRLPGCEFDARFGYPCSEAERRRESARTAPARPPG